eukprot:CAMPEP_0171603136 /NCGR_PEP_ID=MMETSP0990-20121206/5847_1 /TAXON_ID=483369 /ORGANISM="non described non described, Strain CCMP2098" /LENGTH=68 /DNA_ID=CAMNT_0012165443 /DNA_START=37 /DNA_END=243 /DNA_ORIENTATION=+
MADFAQAIELMKHLPIKGVMPSSEEVQVVADVAKSFTTASGSKDPATGRHIPTTEEVDALIAAVRAKS